MEWQLALLILLGPLLFLLFLGMPVFVTFMIATIVGIIIFWGGEAGLRQLTNTIFSSVTNFALLPLPMFILMGEIMYHSGITPNMIAALDNWIGRLPGRLSLLTIGTGTVFSVLSGDSLATVALLGSTLEPEMRKHGYKKSMTLGPILAGGCLSCMIPPSALAIIFGAVAFVSIGKILMAIIMPGLLMAFVYIVYIVIRCWLQPSIAPPYNVPAIPLAQKVIGFVKYILPTGFIIFMVTGVIFLGIATPTEAGVTGALSMVILSAAYRRLNLAVVKKAFFSALRITVMVFMIIVGATAFAQIMAYTGASQGLINLFLGLPLAPIFLMMIMQFAIIILGMFMEPVTIMLVSCPIFMPLVHALGFDPVWYAVLFLINVEVADITPPFALELFVLKGVVSSDTTMAEIYRAGMPFVLLDLLCMAIVMAFPQIALWLPSLMH